MLNLDTFTDNKDIVFPIDVDDIYYRSDLFNYLIDYFGTDKIIDSYDDNTKVKALTMQNK